MSIYVEIRIRAPMDALWEHTQDPALHERWDLRFSTIEYLARPSLAESQRFRYITRVGLGIQVAGEGESLGGRELPGGQRASSLKFSSQDHRSIIREGSGYWKYVPTPEGIRFLTWYEYRTRFGRLGTFFDRIAFQPLMGWATAWSFDRLRLWLEQGIPPSTALRGFLLHSCARFTLAFVFAYHGLVPKLILCDIDEIAMLRDAQIPEGSISMALTGMGMVELAFAAALLIFWPRRWPPALCLVLMPLAALAVGMRSPRYLGAAFNPISLNASVAALAIVDILSLGLAPTASRCRRTPPEDGS